MTSYYDRGFLAAVEGSPCNLSFGSYMNYYYLLLHPGLSLPLREGFLTAGAFDFSYCEFCFFYAAAFFFVLLLF